MDKNRAKGQPAGVPDAGRSEDGTRELHDLPAREVSERALDADAAEQVKGGRNIDEGIKRAVDI